MCSRERIGCVGRSRQLRVPSRLVTRLKWRRTPVSPTCSVTPPKPPLPISSPVFNAFKSGHPYGCGGSLHTDATFIPFLKFCYSTAHTFLGPLRSAHRGLSRLTFCERSPRLLCPREGREDPSLTFCSSFIKLELSFVL